MNYEIRIMKIYEFNPIHQSLFNDLNDVVSAGFTCFIIDKSSVEKLINIVMVMK